MNIFPVYVCREKEKSENKDRKVLEIIQVKDDRIEELQDIVTKQAEEISDALSKKVELTEKNSRLHMENDKLQSQVRKLEIQVSNPDLSVRKTNVYCHATMPQFKTISITIILRPNSNILKLKTILVSDLHLLRRLKCQWVLGSNRGLARLGETLCLRTGPYALQPVKMSLMSKRESDPNHRKAYFLYFQLRRTEQLYLAFV
ncbi:centlein [Elysia marginata]|uniref:Centlein n=1 Tax=Elysia marginata TaxID=1093978 RepID=A0AAV4FU06_9GAST|nr:centlein [Elysia marginata]